MVKFSEELDFSRKLKNIVNGKSKAKTTWTETEKNHFIECGNKLLSGIDKFYEGSITLDEYINDVFVGGWTATRRACWNKVPSQSQILSSVPSAVLAGLFSSLIDKHKHLGDIRVGTEVSGVVGIDKSGVIKKDHDVAIYFESGKHKIAIISWEVKENYIDKTMATGTISNGDTSLTIFPKSKSEIVAPLIQGKSTIGQRNTTMRSICFPYNRHTEANNRKFDIQAIHKALEDADEHLKTITKEDLDNWSLPTYEEIESNLKRQNDAQISARVMSDSFDPVQREILREYFSSENLS